MKFNGMKVDDMSLYIEQRPQHFGDVFGNKAIIESLKSFTKMVSEKRPHTYLFQGPSGCGKTTIARILAKLYGCNPADENVDFLELDAAKKRDVETMRSVLADVQYRPMASESKVFLFDEVHELPRLSQETLLKSAEDTPEHVYFMLCTTDPQKIIKTLKNRCTVFQVESLTDDDMGELLEASLTKQGVDISDKVFDKLIDVAEGSPRRALVYLEQVLSMKDTEKQLNILLQVSAESEVIEGQAVEVIDGNDD